MKLILRFWEKHFNRRSNTKSRNGIFAINYEHWNKIFPERLKIAPYHRTGLETQIFLKKSQKLKPSRNILIKLLKNI
jgi:hypothetical protein